MKQQRSKKKGFMLQSVRADQRLVGMRDCLFHEKNQPDSNDDMASNCRFNRPRSGHIDHALPVLPKATEY